MKEGQNGGSFEKRDERTALLGMVGGWKNGQAMQRQL